MTEAIVSRDRERESHSINVKVFDSGASNPRLILGWELNKEKKIT